MVGTKVSRDTRAITWTCRKTECEVFYLWVSEKWFSNRSGPFIRKWTGLPDSFEPRLPFKAWPAMRLKDTSRPCLHSAGTTNQGFCPKNSRASLEVTIPRTSFEIITIGQTVMLLCDVFS